jgi:hypothetical protein
MKLEDRILFAVVIQLNKFSYAFHNILQHTTYLNTLNSSIHYLFLRIVVLCRSVYCLCVNV